MPVTSPSKGVRVLTLPIEKMYVDPKYQRPLSEKFVQKVVDNFDERQLGVMVLNERDDGTLAVLDGQHRMEAAKRKGRKNLASVVFSIDVQAEGEMFVALQRNRRPVTPLEQHRAMVASKDALAMTIDRITRNAGFRIESGSIASITAIRKVMEGTGTWAPDNYKRALQVIAQAWTEDVPGNRFAYEIVMGLFMFFQRAGNRATVEETVDALFDYTPRAIIRDAKLAAANDDKLSRLGASGWTIAKQFNKHHRRKGVQQISYEVFTPSFRTSLGHRTLKEKGGVNTGQFGSRNEFTSPLSAGSEDE